MTVRTWTRCGMAGLGLMLAQAAVTAPDTAKAGQFVNCVAIAEDQKQRDPDPQMKQHWTELSEIYAANAFFFSQDVNYLLSRIRKSFQTLDNMRAYLPAQSVNNTVLATLKHCDALAEGHPERLEPYLNAMDAYIKEQEAKEAPSASTIQP